jgi:hypothetical protein
LHGHRDDFTLKAVSKGKLGRFSIVADGMYLFRFFLVGSLGINRESLPSSSLVRKRFVGIEFRAGVIDPDRHSD